ncbi:unnamed protein product [Sphagnum jensenii]|uniref:Uncharacterized protein n=1 Tax=Sphagnum jensenii TaxID=128206 RepID=A0ABP1B2Q0_9BRYO
MGGQEDDGVIDEEERCHIDEAWRKKLRVKKAKRTKRVCEAGSKDERDRLLRVEHSGSRSRLISWRIWRGQEGGWRFQQESTDEQEFNIVPSIFEPVKPIHEGVQSEFGG